MDEELLDDETKKMLEFWDGTLEDVKEDKNLIPPTRNVKVVIKDIKVMNEKLVGSTTIERQWKMITFNCKLIDGVEVGEDIKYKGMSINSDFMCYFADPNKYDYKKPYFAKGQFLVPLMQLVKATGVQAPRLMKGGISDENIKVFVDELEGQTVMVNIGQKKIEALNNETGKYEPTDDLKNTINMFKPVPDTDMV